jgi:uncharacterized membrane protein
MTTPHPSTPRSGGSRTLQYDLLDDLRQATPMPAGPASPASSPTGPAPAAAPAVRPTAEPGTPTLELRVTPRRWTAPRAHRLGTGFVIGVGPVQLSCGGWAGLRAEA